jgi:hypothetical protein
LIRIASALAVFLSAVGRSEAIHDAVQGGARVIDCQWHSFEYWCEFGQTLAEYRCDIAFTWKGHRREPPAKE